MRSISIIGPGRLGGALAVALERAGYPIESLVCRANVSAHIASALSSRPDLIPFDEFTRSPAEVIIISTPDPAIVLVCEKLLAFLEPGTIVLHTSGSLPSEVLAPLRGRGGLIGSIHPLISVSDVTHGGASFTDAFFCTEGDAEAVAAANEIVCSLGGRPFHIDPTFKSVYHAAAVMASGHFVALVDAAEELIRRAGVDASVSRELLLPLISSTLQNLRTQKAEDALTGTFARGDDSALERHLSGISRLGSQNIVDIYVALAERSLTLAERKGLDASAIDAMRKRISMAKTMRE